ncbi:hypothetical protein FQN57_005238 [Myotisia sp. PD_48]|nr:hypothetical protein FQN57_005238 [Myotisia sp. PD_48]
MDAAPEQRERKQPQATTSVTKCGARISPSFPAAQLRRRQRSQSIPSIQEDTPLFTPPKKLRRSSTLVDTMSETRQSIQSSTNDLFRPRANPQSRLGSNHGDSFWQSSPLLLALLPALGGVMFSNGSAILTDISLLALSAVFLNWSVRLPWDWYFSAQEVTQQEPEIDLYDLQDIIEKEDTPTESQDAVKDATSAKEKLGSKPAKPPQLPRESTHLKEAKRELHVHELVALASCFVFPVIGAYLLHTIRSQLSRPSEGLVSNYNLTLFLLAAEIRPLSHLLRMVQSRTLYLQRVVEANKRHDSSTERSYPVAELATRLELLESRAAQFDSSPFPGEHDISRSTKDEHESELFKAKLLGVIQSAETTIDNLERAIRKYEKHSAILSFETESRLNDFDDRMDELEYIFNSLKRHYSQGLMHRIVARMLAIVFLPLQLARMVALLPAWAVSWVYRQFVGLTGFRTKRARRAYITKSRKATGPPST